MKRLTPEQLKDIKELREENWFIYNPNSEVNEYIDDLFAEIDALNAQVKELKSAIDDIKLETLAAMSKYLPTPAEGYAFLFMLTDDIRRLGKERDQMKEELDRWDSLHKTCSEIHRSTLNEQNKPLGIAASYQLLHMENEKLRERIEKLESVLKLLLNESKGILNCHRVVIGYDHGNSNFSVLEHVWDKAEKLLEETPGPPTYSKPPEDQL